MQSPRSPSILPAPLAEGGRSATKIVATIGPASEDRLPELIEAGLSVARINFSHGESEDHRRRIEKVRQAAAACDFAVGILADIQGPKLRLGRVHGGRLELAVGQLVRLIEKEVGTAEDELPFNFPGFAGSVKPRDRIFLADAALELVVDSVEGDVAVARVRRGGEVTDRKGVHLPDSNLEFDLPTEQDREHIALARELGVDMLGISFVSRAEEIERIRDLAPDLLLVAKIERRVAIENLRSILESCDGVMVARGDLGVELRLEQLPMVQKSIIFETLAAGKFTITATEMLESMVHASRPTRAEVTDVANAVLDGTDAVMLSAETAVGKFPVEAVTAMSNIARAVETSERFRELDRTDFRASEPTFSNATAMGAVRVAEALGIGKIVCFTESGNTVRLLSRYRTGAEIIALTPSERTMRGMTVLSHVRPMLFPRGTSIEDMLHVAQNTLLEKGMVLHGEEIVFVAGVPPGVSRSTNVMKLHRIGEATRLH
jgi:pyruvate kinase